jgi:hypothetical protein
MVRRKIVLSQSMRGTFNRRLGVPRNDEERRIRHSILYPGEKLPPRGTGLIRKVHETERYYRMRIKQPKTDATKRLLTLSEQKGFKAVRQKPKGKDWETQSILIEKRKGRTPEWAIEKAKELVD